MHIETTLHRSQSIRLLSAMRTNVRLLPIIISLNSRKKMTPACKAFFIGALLGAW